MDRSTQGGDAGTRGSDSGAIAVVGELRRKMTNKMTTKTKKRMGKNAEKRRIQ